MSLVNYSEALEATKPLIPIIQNVFESSLEVLNQMMAVKPGTYYDRSKTGMFHNLVVNAIKEQLGSNEEYQIVEAHESIRLIIDKKLAARFKKLNIESLPSNIRTKRNDLFVSQQLTLEYRDMPEVTCIDIGYRPDVAWSKFVSLKIVCSKNQIVKWEIDVYASVESKAGKVVYFEQPEMFPTIPSQRVVMKSENKEKTAEQ